MQAKKQISYRSTAASSNNNNNSNGALVTCLCFRGMEVMFATASDETWQTVFGLCSRTHLIFQELTLYSTAPITAVQSCPQTGIIVVAHQDGWVQTYNPVPSDALEINFGKFRWCTGPSSGSIFASPCKVSLAYNHRMLLAHCDTLAILDVTPVITTNTGNEQAREESIHDPSGCVAPVLWMTKLPGNVHSAQISGNGNAIAVVLSNRNERQPNTEFGVYTFERDWEDGSSIQEQLMLTTAHAAAAETTTTTTGKAALTRSVSVGILYKPGPFLVHPHPVRKISFRGLGHLTPQYTAGTLQERSGNDLLLTICRGRQARIYGQEQWKLLVEWSLTHRDTTVDWVRGISAFTLGDLETVNKPPNQPRTALDESVFWTTGKQRRNHMYPTNHHQSMPYSTAGAWISEIVRHGDTASIRLSRLTYLRRGMDEASPVVQDCVSSVLPYSVIDFLSAIPEAIWPAWNPWLSESLPVDTTEGTDTLRGSAMTFLGLSSGPATFGDHAWNTPCEIRLTLPTTDGCITVLDFRVSASELESPNLCRLSLRDSLYLSPSFAPPCPTSSESSCLRPYSSISHENGRIVAQTSLDRQSIRIIWRRPGTMSLLPSIWLPEDAERTGSLLSNTNSFRDESLTPAAILLSHLYLPGEHKNVKVCQLFWCENHSCFGGPYCLLIILSSGSVLALELPPPWSASEPILPSQDGALWTASDDEDMGSVQSDTEIHSQYYDVSVVPDPEYGLGLRLESQSEWQCAIAGSFKKHPVTGGALPAERTGLINLGDELISANETNLENMRFDMVITSVREAGSFCGPDQPLILRFRRKLRVAQLLSTLPSVSTDVAPETKSSRRSLTIGDSGDGMNNDGQPPSVKAFSSRDTEMFVACFAEAIHGCIEGKGKMSTIRLPTEITSHLVTYTKGRDMHVCLFSPDAKNPFFSEILSLPQEHELASITVMGATVTRCEIALLCENGSLIFGSFSWTDMSSFADIAWRIHGSLSLQTPCPEFRVHSASLVATKMDQCTLTVWAASPSHDGSVDFTPFDVSVESNENGINDFAFMTSGYLDAAPTLIIFSLSGIFAYVKCAISSEWKLGARIEYNIVRGSGRSSPMAARCLLRGIDGFDRFDAFPHLLKGLFSVCNSQDEESFLRTDWHPDALVANICTNENGASEALQGIVNRLIPWLALEGFDISDEHLPLACAPLEVIYDLKDAYLGEKYKGGKEVARLLESIKSHLARKTKLEGSENIFGESDLPSVLKFMEIGDLQLFSLIATIATSPPEFDSLDTRGQLFLFAASLLLKGRTLVFDESKTVSVQSFTQTARQRIQSASQTERVDNSIQISPAACFAALTSDDQNLLLDRVREDGTKFVWEKVRDLRVAYWLRCDASLAKLAEEIGQAIFRTKRDIMECALFFIIARKIRTLQNLAATDQSESGKKFFKFLTSYDFSNEKGRLAAEKNAFSLLRKCKYRVASAFFLLSNPPSLKSAIETIASKMHDFDLAFFVVRLMTSKVVEKNTSTTSTNTLYGGGAGYASNVENKGRESAEKSYFSKWTPDLSVTAKNLLIDRVMPSTTSQPVMTATILTWLGKTREAAWFLTGAVRLERKMNSVTVVHSNEMARVAFGLPMFSVSPMAASSITSNPISKANMLIDLVSGPWLLQLLEEDNRSHNVASLYVGKALIDRGLEPLALRILLANTTAVKVEESCDVTKTVSSSATERISPLQKGIGKHTEVDSSNCETYDAPIPKAAPLILFRTDAESKSTDPVTKTSSIFDAFQLPGPKKNELSVGKTNVDVATSSIFDDYDLPGQKEYKNSSLGVTKVDAATSSIFDDFDLPRQKGLTTVDVASSSIFDAFDVPDLKSKLKPSVTMSSDSSSIFDAFEIPPSNNKSAVMAPISIQSSTPDQFVAITKPPLLRQDEEELEVPFSFLSCPAPKLWDEWKYELLVTASARRVVREISRIMAKYHGDPPKASISEFYESDLLLPPGVSSVLQLPCDGPSLAKKVHETLESVANFFGVPKNVIVQHTLSMLGQQMHRLIFAIVIKVSIGSHEGAESMLRSFSRSVISSCTSYAICNDGIGLKRMSKSNGSSQFMRRDLARQAWQIESALWLHRGDILPLSGIAIKESVCAVRIGLLLAAWSRSFECIHGLLHIPPDCHTDESAGRHLWTSVEGKSTERTDAQPKNKSSGGWEFLVDCKRSQATEMLRDKPTGCFIIRPHSQDHGVFTLSFKTNLVPTDLDEKVSKPKDPLAKLDVANAESNQDIATRPVKTSDIVQHAIIRLSDSGFRCGSFGPFASLMSLLEAVSASLPFKLRFDMPPTHHKLKNEGTQTSPNAVLLRKIALRQVDSLTSIPSINHEQPRRHSCVDTLATGSHAESLESRLHDKRILLGSFLELLSLSLLCRQLGGVVSVQYKDIHDRDATDKGCAIEMVPETSRIIDVIDSYEPDRILGPFLNWCRSFEIQIVPDFAPERTTRSISLSTNRLSSHDKNEIGAGGDGVLRRMIQQGSGIEFSTLRLVDGGECTVVVLFRREEAISWLVCNGLEPTETSADDRLQDMEYNRYIEGIELSKLPLKQKGASSFEEGITYRFIDPWEVEAVRSREGETHGASLGRSRFIGFSLGKVTLSIEDVLRRSGGVPLLELWIGVKGSAVLTKALASVHPPWDRDAGGDILSINGNVAETSLFLGSIRQHLYRNTLFRRLSLPQRFVALVQVELLDLKNLTSPDGSLSLNVYALLRLKRAGLGAPLNNKARTLDSAATQPVKLSKSSGPNAPASWGSVVRFRFPLAEDVSVDGTSPDKDRESLFRGPPSFLQLVVYERKLLIDNSLGAADVSMDGLWAGGQQEEWVPLRSDKRGITWFTRIRLTLRFELMCLVDGEFRGVAPSVGLQRIEELSRTGGAAHEDFEKRSMSSPDLLSYFESMVY